jgi:hypothetical protein
LKNVSVITEITDRKNDEVRLSRPKSTPLHGWMRVWLIVGALFLVAKWLTLSWLAASNTTVKRAHKTIVFFEMP